MRSQVAKHLRIASVPLLRCVALVRSSVRSARRLVAQNRVYINGQRAQDETVMVSNADSVTELDQYRSFTVLFASLVGLFICALSG